MRPGMQSVIDCTATRVGGLVLIVLGYCLPQLAAENHRGAIVCREEVSAARRSELAHKLQTITGWHDLNFDSDGSLQRGADAVESGSGSARSLITKLLASGRVLILEDASRRSDVVFARVVPGRWKNSSSSNPIVSVVMIDFSDFDRLMGDRQALEAFNVGWALLHEIDHVVNDSADSKVGGHVGTCEDHINLMRRECHLPARLDYFFNFFPNSEKSDFRTRLVRLAFEQEDVGNKHRLFWVIWDAMQVGGLDVPGPVAAL